MYIPNYPPCYRHSMLGFGCGSKNCPKFNKGECTMIEKYRSYPAYEEKNEDKLQQRVTMFFTYEQVLEIANIIYYINLALARVPRWLGGIRLSADKRALHKSLHDSAINCLLSLDEKARYEKEGGKEQ